MMIYSAIFLPPFCEGGAILQLRDPKNDFILNFNFNDKMKIFEQFEFGTK